MAEPLRVVLDAMVFARGFAGRNRQSACAAIYDAWRNGSLIALLNGQLVEEIRATLAELGVRDDDTLEFVTLLCSQPQNLIAIQHQRMGCTDPHDDHLFETALLGKARWIVSDDSAVLNLPNPARLSLEHRHVGAISSSEFARVLRARETADEESVLIDDVWDLPGPFSCLICNHSDHADVACGVLGEGTNGDPVECDCPGALELNLA